MFLTSLNRKKKQKNRWTFQIYDEDNSGEIDQDEMINVMTVKRRKKEKKMIKLFSLCTKCWKEWAADHPGTPRYALEIFSHPLI